MYRLAWEWFLDKYGLVMDWDIEDNCLIFESCNDIYKIIFNAKENQIKFNKLYIRGNPLKIIFDAISGKMDGEHGYPFVDEIADRLFESILSLVVRCGGTIVWKRFWKDGDFAVCLTHDVDEIRKTYQFLTRTLRSIRKGDLRGIGMEVRSFLRKLRGNDPYWTFEKIMELEESLGIRSSFYFLKERGKVRITDRKSWRHLGRRYSFEDVRDVMVKMIEGGWDVGLHGSFHSYDNKNLLRREKSELEEVLGDRVVGIRQHNLNLNIPKTWRIQEELGFLYDTSLGSNRRVTFRWGTCFPFYPIDGSRKLNVIQIPLIVEDIALMRYDNPWKILMNTMSVVRKHGGVLTLLWHHSVFGGDYPGWDDIYRRIILICKKEGAWIGSGRDVAEWWTFRRKNSVRLDVEDRKVYVYSEVPVGFVSGGRDVRVFGGL